MKKLLRKHFQKLVQKILEKVYQQKNSEKNLRKLLKPNSLEQIFLKKYIKTLGENALKFFQKSCTENP
jgi:16S rRNA C967 or C1407 C5-methylase (RsmB/RsmF family)